MKPLKAYYQINQNMNYKKNSIIFEFFKYYSILFMSTKNNKYEN